MTAILYSGVSRTAWAIKQRVQPRHALRYIVRESAWKMFHAALGAHARRAPHGTFSRPIL
ncbi:hypothetical protein [Burkholderia pseudomallei]|uniref:hypothetical protein n=1 Tax=Burkholderia pseudomallei TaxID=28450 RepID=UPI000CCEED20|nr:hypothetical protein [Burkholderia pseudomallei]PNX24163.1 hypothetical protein CF642_37725 [Burkholderia pseudomallei]